MSAGPAGPPDRLAESAAAVVRTVSMARPRVAIVLGSGLGPALGDALRVEDTIAYGDLPGFPAITVPGHTGSSSWASSPGCRSWGSEGDSICTRATIQRCRRCCRVWRTRSAPAPWC